MAGQGLRASRAVCQRASARIAMGPHGKRSTVSNEQPNSSATACMSRSRPHRSDEVDEGVSAESLQPCGGQYAPRGCEVSGRSISRGARFRVFSIRRTSRSPSPCRQPTSTSLISSCRFQTDSSRRISSALVRMRRSSLVTGRSCCSSHSQRNPAPAKVTSSRHYQADHNHECFLQAGRAPRAPLTPQPPEPKTGQGHPNQSDAENRGVTHTPCSADSRSSLASVDQCPPNEQ